MSILDLVSVVSPAIKQLFAFPPVFSAEVVSSKSAKLVVLLRLDDLVVLNGVRLEVLMPLASLRNANFRLLDSLSRVLAVKLGGYALTDPACRFVGELGGSAY
jgi:hypothetical protein